MWLSLRDEVKKLRKIIGLARQLIINYNKPFTIYKIK